MKKQTQSRFRKNYPGVPIFYADDAGIPKAVWLAKASGSDRELMQLKNREKTLFKLAIEWKAARILPPINSAYIIWAAMIHDNYRKVAEWLRDEINDGRSGGNVENVGECEAFFAYFVYKTLDQKGGLMKVASQLQVKEIGNEFYGQLPAIREIAAKSAMKELIPGEKIYKIFLSALSMDLPPIEAAKKLE